MRLLIPLGIIAGLFALGLWYFNREAPLHLGEAVAMSAARDIRPSRSSRRRSSACARAWTALESELVEVQARTNAAVAEWQERAYWLDRWHLDLNALMRRPGAAELRAAVRAVRSVVRAFRRVKRSLSRS